MDKYTLTIEGRARFRRMKISVDVTMPHMEGYEVLNYLYDHGADTVEGVAAFTGMSREQAVSHLLSFMNHGFVEEMA